jgi:hypothetical protein
MFYIVVQCPLPEGLLSLSWTISPSLVNSLNISIMATVRKEVVGPDMKRSSVVVHRSFGVIIK